MQDVITKGGQVTIPKPIRDRLGLSAGSIVDFAVGADGRAYLRKVEVAPAEDRFDLMRGSLKSDMTTDEIMAMTRGED